MLKTTQAQRTFLAATFLSTSMLATDVLAQVIPGSARPERAGERFQEAPRPAVGVGPIIDSGKDADQVKIAEGTKFTLKSVSFEGVSGVNEAEIQAITKEYVDQKVSLATLREMTTKITAQLRNNGYILSRAVLPPQTIGKSGAVKIRVIEGYVNSVSFTGDADGSSGILSSMADKIRNSKPLKAEDLERYLLLMEDLPGVTARATIKPAAGVVGASDVIVNIDQKPFDLNATLDNRGSRFLGQLQGSTSVSANNLFGLYDRTQVRILKTPFESELRYGEIVHEEQIGSEGTKALFSASHTESAVGHTLKSADIDGQTRTFTLAVRHPFLRSRQDNIYGTLEAVARDTDTEVTAANSRLYNDRTRTLKATGSYDFVDTFQAVNKTDFSVMHGFDIFDTDPAGGFRSRADGEVSFTKLNASVSRLQPIDGPFSLLTSATGQYSFDPLLASEEFGLGGEEFASAYDPSEVTGDHGAAAKLELQYNQYPSLNWLQYYQLYTYVDAGKVWNKGNLSANDSTPLTSTGLGVRFNTFNAVSGSFDVALPINRPVNANGRDGFGPRAFFTLAYRY